MNMQNTNTIPLDLDPDLNKTIGSLAGETLVLDINGEPFQLQELAYEYDTSLMVTTMDNHGRIKPAKAHSFRIGEWTNKLTKITLDNGHSFICTSKQQFMCANGEWLEAGDIAFGTILNTAIYNPATRNPYKMINQVSHAHTIQLDEMIPTFSFSVNTQDNLLIAQTICADTMFSLIPAHQGVSV